MTMTDDKLREAHDRLDTARAEELKEFKLLTVQHQSYLASYKAAKQALARRPKDPVGDPDDDGEVSA